MHRLKTMAETLLALDIGTTTVRAILFDLAGRPLAEAYREPCLVYPQPDWAEADPEEWWQQTVAVIGEVLQRAAISPGEILGVGLSGLLHALVPIDRQGRALARPMLWMDQRCQPQVEWMQQEHGALLARVMGPQPLTTTWSAPKLRWIADHEPDLLRRTYKFLSAKDFIRFRLTGTVATDPSDAGNTYLYDAAAGDWSREILALVGVPMAKMAPIRPSTEVAGGVSQAAAAATGLAAGTPVVIGAGDTTCTRTGADALAPGRACLYLGTAAWISIPGYQEVFFGSTATTGAALKWLAGLLGLDNPGESPAEIYGALLDGTATVPAGAQGLLFLPHLMGERGPQPDPKARGVFFGITLAHGRREMARAVLEGCAFHLRSILDSLGGDPVRELVVAGGGAKSPLWREIIADVTGRRIRVPQVLEAAALGAAILAGTGVGVYPGVEEAAGRLVRIAEIRPPDPARHGQYSRIYAAYLELEQRVAPLYGRVPD